MASLGHWGVALNIASIIEDHDPAHIALVDGERTLTYGELRTRTAQVRAALVERRLAPDERVVLIAGNEPAFIVASLAVVGVGARVVPMKPTNPVPELLRKLDVVQPSLILVGDDAAWVLEHRDSLGAPVELINSMTSGGEQAITPRSTDDIAFMLSLIHI